ncbi:YrdB family protein [Rarobacter incanus]|uniref:Uncharacterized protein DUF2568 n=1 Tax=Rarobacter incanus TaxID=153494 RepID=A0A542SNP3_9MICO|nr:YrdB family protein [Rarobacter incanus]TQK75877.1 uncharacterized protein DUF2568 [Rarobacter incanus]
MSDTDPFVGAGRPLALALIVRFLLELALLAGVAAVTWQHVSGGWRLPAAMLAVVAVATVWGLFLSPKAPIALPPVVALLIEAILFLGVGTALFLTGSGTLAVIGFAAWLADRIALAVLQR